MDAMQATQQEIHDDVKRSLEGDRQAFGRLIEAYDVPVRCFLQRMVGDFHNSQDLAQETYLKAFTSLKNLDAPSSFRAWLFRIAFHVAVDFRRRRDSHSVSLETATGGSVADEMPRDERVVVEAEDRQVRYMAVVRAVASLPEAYSLVLVLRYLEHRTYDEMATALDLSLNNVKVRLHRAKRMIRNRVAAEGVATVLEPSRQSKQGASQ